jgi:hypothetical protein
MRFSEKFLIRTDPKDDWFDPVLSVDTNLFIDPFLIFAREIDHFVGSHKEIIGFFNDVFKLVAQSGGKRTSVLWKKAESLLRFPEAEELCIGYTESGTGGSGSGSVLAKLMTEALW